MDMKEIIRTRKSVRTFDGRPLTTGDREKLLKYVETIENPYHIPVAFVLLDKNKHGLSSPVIVGEDVYIAAKVPKVSHAEEAFGYSFEKMVLYAWSLGIGTTWIGGTLDRKLFEKAADTAADEYMMIVSPLGYPAAEPSEVDRKLRAKVRGDERLPASAIFYDGNFQTPLVDVEALAILESVRWYPSAANMQPCRIVRDGNKYHFYEQHTTGYRNAYAWDVQKIDMGIALCHFMSVTKGSLTMKNPDLDVNENMEYIATVVVKE